MRDLVSEFFPKSVCDRGERLTFAALAGCVSVSLVSIAASQILLAAALLGTLWLLRRGLPDLQLPPLVWPLAAFVLWTIVAALKSADVALALTIGKKFYLALVLLVVPLIARRRQQIMGMYHCIFALSFVAALAGLIQFATHPERDLLHRISGFMSQWMTYSGLLMLVLVALGSYFVCFSWRRRPWVLGLGLLLIAALYLTQTRNAWLGAIMGLATVFALTRPKAIGALAAAIAMVYLLSPVSIQERLRTGWDIADPNTRNRIELFQTSLRMIRDNPWFGVGPKNVGREALRYRGNNEYPDWMYLHMHNNALQIAAERGIPGLLLWCWLMGRLAWDAARVYRRARLPSPSPDGSGNVAMMASLAALGGWVALSLAGLFEYNFGDSEVLTLFLFIMAAPYVFLTKPEIESRPLESGPAAGMT
jgi:O-antigen ligase